MAFEVRWILIAGVVACVPAAVFLVIFGTAAADQVALSSAGWCESQTTDSASSCVSTIEGTITGTARHYRSLDRATIAVGGSSVDVGYACFVSPAACSDIVFKAGGMLTTGWWKGRVVLIGPAGSRPSVITDESPAWQLRQRVGYLMLVVICMLPLTAGLFMWQAPTAPPTSRWGVWRAAWGDGRWTFFAAVAWQSLFIAALVYMFRTSQFLLAPAFLLASGLLSYVIAAVAVGLYAQRRAVPFRRMEESAFPPRPR